MIAIAVSVQVNEVTFYTLLTAHLHHFFGFFYRTFDDGNNPGLGCVNSISGANKKRRRKAPAEDDGEQTDSVTSSDSSGEEVESDATDKKEENVEDDVTSPVKTMDTNLSQSIPAESKPKQTAKPSTKKPAPPSSQPAIFIPVDRSPEIQVCILTP